MLSISTAPTLVLILFLTRHARAQLVGCETVRCPAGGCVVGNVTNLDLGIASFTSDISPGQDLTWTVGLADTPQHNSINDTWLKSYYLGTPSTLDLRTRSDISGCALFFEDESVQFNISASETSLGTCQDALNTECVDDLLALATNSTAWLSSGSINGNKTYNPSESYVCSQLREKLIQNLPTTCQSKGLGREIVVKELTSSSSSLIPAPRSSCNISTGGPTYNVALAESRFFRSDTYVGAVSEWIFGVTPILTVFCPRLGPNSTFFLQGVDAHLTCVKIVEPGASDSDYPRLLNAASSFGQPHAWVVASALFLMAPFFF